MKGKRSLKFVVGTTVLVLTTLMLVTIPLWTGRWGNVDFPCEWFGPPPNLAQIGSNSRIAYCISVYPRNAYGGSPLAYGSSEAESATIKIDGYLNLQRKGSNLIVDNQVLLPGETVNKLTSSFTLNPWLLATTELSITNEGQLKSDRSGSKELTPDVIFVAGTAKEGWAFTPLGFLFYGIGLGLLIIDAILRKRKASAV